MHRGEIREVWRPLELAELWRTLRLAFRSLARNPGFALLAVVTLGLGIGANTSMFTTLNGILLKPLPYSDGDQLERIYRATPQNPLGHFAPADVVDFLRTRHAAGEGAAYTLVDASLSDPGHLAEMAVTGRVTANLLSLLGTSPQLGRGFRSEEDTPGRDRVVILSQRTWINRFGGRQDVIGRTIRLDGEPHEIIGVLPQTFNDWRHFGGIDLFRPLALGPAESADRNRTSLRLLFRRSRAHSRAEVAGYVANFGARLASDHPEANAESTWRMVSLHRSAIGPGANTTLPMLIGLSAFVVLIACGNLANLLLARTMARARELAVRAALGASRHQLLRPLMAESLLLALASSAVAMLVALWFRDWNAMRSTMDNGEQVVFELGWRVAGWAFAASLVTAVTFSIAPALFALRLDLNDVLKSGGRGTTGGPGHRRFRHAIIVSQFALAMVLLSGAGVFIRGLHGLNHRRSGWTSERLVTGSIVLPAAKYSDAGKITDFHRLALERLGTLPGVASAGISSFTPFANWPDIRRFLVEGRDRPRRGHEPAAVVNSVSPGYFETVNTRVLAGRAFNDRDTANSTKVFVVGHAAARGLFGGENPIGRRLAQVGENLVWGEIVGVVSDVQSAEAEPTPVPFQLYQPMAQEPRAANALAVRTTAVAAATVVESIRATIADLDPDLPVRQLQSADATILRTNFRLAFLRDMLVGFAVLGLSLASLGIYGIIARTMAQRAGEFAIRMALGARIENIVRMVFASGMKLALLGSTLGLFGAYGVSRLLAFRFPGIQANELVVLIGTTLLLTAVALVACYVPARNASRISAVDALRAE